LLQPADPSDFGEDAGPRTFVIRLKPTRALYSHGNETALLLRELRRLGETRVSMDASALPPLEALDPAEGYAVWTIELTTSEGEDAVREVFEFVDGHCELDIGPADDETPMAELAAEPLPAPEPSPPLIALPSAEPANSEPEGEVDVAALILQAQAA